MEYTIELWLHPAYAQYAYDEGKQICAVYHITDTELHKFLNNLYEAVGQSFDIYWQGNGATITLPMIIKKLPDALQVFA